VGSTKFVRGLLSPSEAVWCCTGTGIEVSHTCTDRTRPRQPDLTCVPRERVNQQKCFWQPFAVLDKQERTAARNVRDLKKAQQSPIRVACLSDGIVGQEELANCVMEEGFFRFNG
jgi:hypothetical protein